MHRSSFWRVSFKAAGMALAGALMLFGAAHADDGEKGAGEFLRNLQETAVAELGEKSIPMEQREKRFRELFRKNFDLDSIGRFVLGRYWRAAEESQRREFLAVFEDAMVQRFLPLLADQESAAFHIEGVQNAPNSPSIRIVNTKIERPQGKPYDVAWRIRNEDDGFKILDIVAEGVSMAITLRSEYASALKQMGGNVGQLTEELRRKVAAGAFAPQI